MDALALHPLVGVGLRPIYPFLSGQASPPPGSESPHPPGGETHAGLCLRCLSAHLTNCVANEHHSAVYIRAVDGARSIRPFREGQPGRIPMYEGENLT